MNSVEEIEARATAATAGPWMWAGNTRSRQIHLCTVHSGRIYVMGFERWGFNGAQPTFQRNHRIEKVEGMVEYQVCPACESKDDPRVYREDFFRIKHPDAEFIAHSREDVDFLIKRVRELERTVECLQDERAGLLAAVPA